MRVLVVNAGSSSVKLRVLDGDELAGSRDLSAHAGRFDADELDATLAELGEVAAAGHRIVHGGPEFRGPVRIDEAVHKRLTALVELAPLHQRFGLAGIDAVAAIRPDLPMVACFDTAFHADLPAAAATYPIPREWRDRYGIRRYGFHGLSHSYASRRTAAMLGLDAARARIVVCHLGSGASLCAVSGGRSMDTTMGFTPLEGIVMATRSGTVDPGLILWLQRQAGLSADEVYEALEYRSGLAALAGTPDMRKVIESGDTAALDVYLHRLRAAIATMAAAMGGLDALAFTGGVGEHAPMVRAGAADGLAFLGVAVDPDANAAEPDAVISPAGARVPAVVVTAREDIEIARQTRDVLSNG